MVDEEEEGNKVGGRGTKEVRSGGARKFDRRRGRKK